MRLAVRNIQRNTNPAQRQEHGHLPRTPLRPAAPGRDREESESFVVAHSFSLRVHDDAYTANPLSLIDGKLKRHQQKGRADSRAGCPRIDGKPCDPKQGQGVGGRRGWDSGELITRSVRNRNRHVPKDSTADIFDGNVRDPQVVHQLVLPCVATKELVELDDSA